MFCNALVRNFDALGARVKIGPLATGNLRIDIGSDREGEFFDLRVNAGRVSDVLALETDAKDRHLLLFARTTDEKGEEQKERFLCGHDERHWFVAAVPSSVSRVREAKEALKPAHVRRLQNQLGVRFKDRNRRKNEAFVRQGEWFFVPAGKVLVNEKLVLHNEPIRRGRGKPHLCEFLYRTGGEVVYVSQEHPNGIPEAQYRRLIGRKPSARNLNWRTMRRNMDTLVRGRITHPDHKTLVLKSWHWVQMNTEWRAPAMRHVAFLD